MTILDTERSAARMQSYTGKAILVLVLYLVLWLPGFIANILFHSEARRMEKKAGEGLPGTGCLAPMLYLNLAGFALGALLLACSFGLALVG